MKIYESDNYRLSMTDTPMRNLIWQYHIDTQRTYDGPHRKRVSMASAKTVLFYAMKYGVEYQMANHSNWWVNGYHGGPAMERFQILDERYDVYDYILYIDTDILISDGAPNIFEEYGGATVAGINQMHSRDKALLTEGWLKSEFEDPKRYHQNYVNGAILLLSREFRQYLRGVFSIEDIQEDKGTHWDRNGLTVRWPVYDQSMVSYWLAMSPYSLTPIAPQWYRGPYFFNHGGTKNDTEKLQRYFSRHTEISETWLPNDYAASIEEAQ